MKIKNSHFVFLLFCFICFFSFNSHAQLIVDAGNDTIVCSGYNYDENEQIRIGGNPTAIGGVEPYTYTWSGARKLFPTSKHMLYASDILDDTTQCKPTFKRNFAPEEWFTFHLKVEDAANHIGYDSVRIRRSGFVYNMIAQHHVYICLGDSIQLNGNIFIDGDFWPFTFSISPSDGLSDSTDLYGWAKPDRNIRYYLTAFNSIGCISKEVPYLDIDVDTITALNNVLVNPKIQCFFARGDLIINLPQKQSIPYQVTIAAITGGVIHSGSYCDRNLRITKLKLRDNQVYLITIFDGNARMTYKLLHN